MLTQPCRFASDNMTSRPLFAIIVFLCVLSPAFALESAQQLLGSGHVDEAIQILERDTERSATNGDNYNLLCRAYFMLDEWDKGIAACERARNLDPQKSLYQLWLGRAYGEKAERAGFLSAAGLAKKVRVSFERAVELDPKSSAARTDLGEFYAEAPSMVGGGKDKARQQAEALMQFDPARGHWLLARIAEKNKDSSLAESEYRAAVATSHNGARAWLDLANFFF